MRVNYSNIKHNSKISRIYISNEDMSILKFCDDLHNSKIFRIYISESNKNMSILKILKFCKSFGVSHTHTHTHTLLSELRIARTRVFK
jgi:hypothetical protein